jgi:hypothetical protein
MTTASPANGHVVRTAPASAAGPETARSFQTARQIDLYSAASGVPGRG